MSIWRRSAVTVMVAVAAFATVTGARSADGEQLATVYSRTVSGIDFHALDFRISTQFVSNSGGGVYAQAPFGAYPATIYLEAGIDLPVGANVTAVTFIYMDCGTDSQIVSPLGYYYFGSYRPLNGTYLGTLGEDHGGFGTCGTVYKFTRSGTPITTVLTDRRYILGARPTSFAVGTVQDSTPDWILMGARVKYTCPSTCA